MTRLILVRHGETDWNVSGQYQGQSDPPLNADGRDQAQALAVQLRGAKIDAVYSSDLKRARETAQIIADALHPMPVAVDRRLREIALGEWEGLRPAQVTARYALEWAERQQSPVDSRAPGGESVAQVAARMLETADDIARVRPGEHVLVVSHGLALATLLCLVRGLGLERARDLIPDNARPEEVEWTPD